jgi:hypothetical protein
MRPLLILYMLLFPVLLQAQTITGYVTDSITQEPVPFANVVFKKLNRAASTDSLGFFQIDAGDVTNADTFFVYCLGYKPQFFTAGQKIIAKLSPTVFEIDGGTVAAFKPSTIIRNMFKRLSGAVLISEGRAFYRQLHTENEKAVRLIEADIDVKWNDANSEVALNEMRRSNNQEKNGLQHGDHLFDLLDADPVRHQEGTVLNAKNSAQFAYGIEDETEFLYIIRFTEKDKTRKTYITGQLAIDKENFNLVSYSMQRIRNPRVPVEFSGSATEKYTWDIRTESITADYTWKDNTIQLDKLERSYYHHLISNVFKTTDYRVGETFFLYIYTHPLSNTGRLVVRSSLYGRQYDYHPAFWNDYFPLKTFPLDKQYEKQLSEKMSLPDQYQASSKADFHKR